MKANAFIKDGCLYISGELIFTTVADVWKESLPFIKDCKDLQIDLSHSTTTNSAALALLLEWVKYARSLNKSITFKNMPSQLLSIAKVAGIDKIFTII